MDLLQATCADISAAVSAGRLTAVSVAEFFLERIQTHNPQLNALLWSESEQVLQQAAALDTRIADGGSAGPLAGVPVVLKDNMCVKGQPTTCGSHMLKHYRPPYSAFVTDSVQAADAIIIGKANLDEFAMGSSNENSAFGPVLNPRSTDRVPGGSSGGSAVAVAAGFAPVSLGSDTGGSIRQPASHTGVVGMKPTYGRVSRYGLVAFGSSLDQIGPFARNVADLKLLLSVISGPDPRDGTNKRLDSLSPVVDGTTGLKGLKIGVPAEYMVEGIGAEVLAVFEQTRDKLVEAGAELVEVSIPHTEYGVAVYYIIACAEASSNLARYDGVHYGHRAADHSDLISMFANSRAEGFGDEVKRRILLGTHVLSAGYYDAYYNKALKVRSLLKQDFLTAFKACDLILSPVAPTPAFKLGELVDDPLAMYLSDIFTISVNLAGVPGISLPAGTTPDGLPVGVQFIGPHFSEEKLLNAAASFEQIRGFDVAYEEMGSR